jgi:sulfate transport system permease protein
MRVPRVPGAALAGGISMLYLSIIVLIPLAAVVAKSLELGLDQFWAAVTNEQALAALKLTVGASFVVAGINALAARSASTSPTRRPP